MRTSLIAMTMAASLVNLGASAGNLADPIVTPQVVAADAIDTSNNRMHETLALLTVTLILTLAITSR